MLHVTPTRNGNSYGSLVKEAGSTKIPLSIRDNQIFSDLNIQNDLLTQLKGKLKDRAGELSKSVFYIGNNDQQFEQSVRLLVFISVIRGNQKWKIPSKNIKKTVFLSMSQPELLLLCFDEAIRNLRKAQISLDDKEYEYFEASLQKTSRIIRYLTVTLEMECADLCGS
jgi:hypothetical protein